MQTSLINILQVKPLLLQFIQMYITFIADILGIHCWTFGHYGLLRMAGDTLFSCQLNQHFFGVMLIICFEGYQ